MSIPISTLSGRERIDVLTSFARQAAQSASNKVISALAKTFFAIAGILLCTYLVSKFFNSRQITVQRTDAEETPDSAHETLMRRVGAEYSVSYTISGALFSGSFPHISACREELQTIITELNGTIRALHIRGNYETDLTRALTSRIILHIWTYLTIMPDYQKVRIENQPFNATISTYVAELLAALNENRMSLEHILTEEIPNWCAAYRQTQRIFYSPPIIHP